MPFEEQDWLTSHVPGEVLIYLGFVSPRDLRDVHEDLGKRSDRSQYRLASSSLD